MVQVVAQGGQDGNLGWWVGLIVGCLVVVVVVAAVAAVLTYASRLGEGSQKAAEALEAARTGMRPLAEAELGAGAAADLVASARTAGRALGPENG